MVQVFETPSGAPFGACSSTTAYLTDLRTAAAGALAADVLARPGGWWQAGNSRVRGCQARYQLDALLGVRQPGVGSLVWGRNEEKARDLRQGMTTRYTQWLPRRSSERASPGGRSRAPRWLITTTASTDPLVRRGKLGLQGDAHHHHGLGQPRQVRGHGPGPGQGRQGGGGPPCRSAFVIGEIHHAVARGASSRRTTCTPSSARSLAGTEAGAPERKDEITVADLTGVGIQDAAVADFVMEEAERRNLGQLLSV